MVKKLTLAIWLSVSFASLTAQNIDIDLLKSINPSSPGSDFWQVTGHSAYYLPVSIAAGSVGYGLLSKNKDLRRRGYELVISIGISAVITQSLKYTVDRTRPADKYPNEVFVTKPVHGKSFPSGHTTIAFATATTLTLQYKKWYIAVPAYLWAGAAGYSRLYAGEHYPSDVLSGALIGVGGAYLAHWVSGKIFRK
ncbi:MAG: phosphatase PAP2 family protein [Chitinophagaceae bacterium]|nr:MAG: phosphatase PAP2 family protein [Chitinophagaceae bacterium]